MQKSIEILLIVIIAMLLTQSAYATDARGLTVQELKEWCESNDERNRLICQIFVSGANDGILAVRTFSVFGDHKTYEDFDNTQYCWRRETTIEQLVDIFLKWSREHPEDYQISAGTGVMISYTEAFCRKGK